VLDLILGSIYNEDPTKSCQGGFCALFPCCHSGHPAVVARVGAAKFKYRKRLYGGLHGARRSKALFNWPAAADRYGVWPRRPRPRQHHQIGESGAVQSYRAGDRRHDHLHRHSGQEKQIEHSRRPYRDSASIGGWPEGTRRSAAQDPPSGYGVLMVDRAYKVGYGEDTVNFVEIYIFQTKRPP
jgi:hypothetical protein